jgi:hypothetical protein
MVQISLSGILRGGFEKLGHQRLRKPDRFVLKAAFHAGLAVLGGVEDEFAARLFCLAHVDSPCVFSRPCIAFLGQMQSFTPLVLQGPSASQAPTR